MIFGKRILIALTFLILTTSCAELHHVQLSDIEYTTNDSVRPIEVMVSETGLNLDEAAATAKGFTQNTQTQRQIETINQVIALFQMGPTTGNKVFSDRYTEDLVQSLTRECPRGRITGITSIRETRKYPIISGEIVKIRAFCVSKRNTGT